MAARIDTLIRRGQYLTQDAAADRGRQEAAEGALPKETAPDANEENRAEQGEEADEPVSTEDSAATADAAENPASSETTAYAVGDTVYLDDTLFVIEAKSAFGVQLRDPSQRYPIFRAESLPRFERLLAADERNAHFLPAAETALRNIVLDLSASASEQREPAPEQPAAENFRIADEHLGEGSAKAKFSALYQPACHPCHLCGGGTAGLPVGQCAGTQLRRGQFLRDAAGEHEGKPPVRGGAGQHHGTHCPAAVSQGAHHHCRL